MEDIMFLGHPLKVSFVVKRCYLDKTSCGG